MTDDTALYQLLGSRPLGVLATIKRDGRPQLSNVNHHLNAAKQTLQVSITEPRAPAELTDYAKAPDDDVVEARVYGMAHLP